jgi:hypothetical protein
LRMGLGFARHHTPPRESSASENGRFLRRRLPVGCSTTAGDRRRARRDVRCAPSVILDTGKVRKFPHGRNTCCLLVSLERRQPAAGRNGPGLP